METMQLYERLRTPPKEALRKIEAGRLRGFTDINPMWRIKAMTEAFGPCGIGWGTTDETFWLESGADEVTVQCSLRLWYRDPKTGDKSAPLFGVGGSKLVVIEKDGPRLDDEAYKKARTDAIGVAMKDLGMAADVYFAADSTSKYTGSGTQEDEKTSEGTQAKAKQTGTPVQNASVNAPVCSECGAVIEKHGEYSAQNIAAKTKAKYGRVLCMECAKDEKARMEAGA